MTLSGGARAVENGYEHFQHLQGLMQGIGTLGMTAVTVADANIATTHVIKSVVYNGNKRTKDKILSRELNIAAGDEVTHAQVQAGRQAIMDLGLFKSVETELQRASDGTTLLVNIDEKHYWFLLPKLSRSGDGDVSYGAGFQIDNLMGLGHELQMSVKRKDYKDADIDKAETIELEYAAPRLFDTAFDVNLDLRLQESNIDESTDTTSNNRFDRSLDYLTLTAGRWLNNSGVSNGWRFNAGVKYLDYRHEFVSGDPQRYFDASSVSMIGGVQNFDVHDLGFSRSGRHYGIDIEQALSTTGQNNNFARAGLFVRGYKPVTRRKHTNLNLQLRAGYARNPLFGDDAFSLANSRTLRGFERDSIEGNAYAVANVEFMAPFSSKRPALRGVLFADAGSVWRGKHSDSNGKFHYSVGVGLRWKIRSLVKTELRVDYAHGFGDGIDKLYIGTRSTF